MTQRLKLRHTALTWAGAGATALLLATALPAYSQMATAAISADVAAAFKRADTNSDGKLSKEEAAMFPTIAAHFDELDKDKDGFLSLEEFAAGMAAPK